MRSSIAKDLAHGWVPAHNRMWGHFSVSVPAPYAKQSPLSGATSGTRRVMLQWAAAPNASYLVCWDTIDNGACDTMWWPSPIPTQAVSSLAPGTYYWQVKTAGGGIPADNGAWHHFAVSAPALYVKQSPGNGATGLGPTVTLQWSAVPDEGYYVCWDTTNNNACDTTWWPTDAGTARVLEGLTTGTYYWQVRTAGGAVLADNGAWHAFTVSTTALFTKQRPANGATGLGSAVTLSWSSVPDEGYYVCWDTTDNNICDATWWPTAAGTSRVVEGLSPGTYYWQARTAGGAVLADNGTWHHFTVSAAPGAALSMPRGMDGRSIQQNLPLVVVGAGLLALAALLIGPRRRRRVVAAGVMVFVLAPAAALAQTTTQVIEYYTTDAIGSVRAVTKQVNGQWQVTRHDFMPFGEEVSPQNPPQDKRLFTGKERDYETGLDYFEARYYGAAVGRFTTIDPVTTPEDNLVDPQRWNRYAYARQNPLKYLDPTGATLEASGDTSLLLDWAREAVGKDAANYVDLEWNKKARRWEFAITGIGLSAFRKLSGAASRLADIVTDDRLAIVKHISAERLPNGNAGYTYDVGERNGNSCPVVLLNQDAYGANALTAQSVLFRAKFDDMDNVRTMTMGIIMFHELIPELT